MKSQHPLLRLLSLTAIAIVMALTAMMGLRWLGSQEKFSPSRHPWMNGSPWRLARLAPTPCDQGALGELLRLDEAWKIWLDVRQNPMHDWTIVCPEHPFALDGAGRQPEKPLRLKDVLGQLRNRGVIFNVMALDMPAANSFLQTIESWAGKREDIGIASPVQSLLRELRKKRPEWLFAADSSTWTKLKMYSGFGIETAVDLWPDFFIASDDPAAPNFFSIPAANEIARRNKALLLEWNGISEIPPPEKERLQGILTTRPKNFPVDAIFTKMGAK
jgi:hypothetical protein